MFEKQLLPISRGFISRHAATANNGKALREMSVAVPQGLFSGWKSKLATTLGAAYPVYLDLLAGGEAARREVLEHCFFKSVAARGGRRSSGKNLALLALQVVAQPQDEAQRKACSDYALMLVHAAWKEVEPQAFTEVAESLTLRGVKADVRLLRKASKARAPTARPLLVSASDTDSPPFLEGKMAPLSLLTVLTLTDGSTVQRALQLPASAVAELHAVLQREDHPTAAELYLEIASVLAESG